eukprot:Nk52_evm1s1475 gene=Nk52_evmTU1s1475
MTETQMKFSADTKDKFATAEIVDTVKCELENDVEIQDYSAQHSGTGVLKTVVNIICTMVGVGILGLPTAVASTGWMVGLVFMVIGAFFATYCGVLLSKCMHDGNPDKKITSYEELGMYAGGRVGKYAAIITSYGTCFSACILMLILGGQMWDEIIGKGKLSLTIWTAICALIVLPFNYIKTMGHVAYVSIFGMLASIMVFVVVLGQDINEISDNGAADNVKLSNSSDFQTLANAFVTMVFSFGGAAVFPELMRNMKKQSRFPTAMYIAFPMMFCIYAGISVPSYFTYGDQLLTTECDGNITNLMPKNWLSKFVFAMVLIHVLSAFVVLMNPVSRALEVKFHIDNRKDELFWRIVLRSILVGIAFFIAILLPFFGDIMTLIGGTTVTGSSFVLPVWFYLRLFTRRTCIEPLDAAERRRGWANAALCIFILLVSVFTGVVGTYTAIENIVDKWSTYSLF